jgi:hypothetical protein
MNLFDQFMNTQSSMQSMEGQRITNQFNLAKLNQMKNDQEMESKSRQLGMEIAQGNLAKSDTKAPAVTLANLSEIPDAAAESMGAKAYAPEVAKPATAPVPKNSEVLAQQAEETKQAALKFQAIGNIKQGDALMKEHDQIREKLYNAQAEERKAESDRAGKAAAQMAATNSQPALNELWNNADAEHRQAFAPFFNLGLDGKPIYDDKAIKSLEYFGNKAMSAKDQSELKLKAVKEQLAAQTAETQRLRAVEQERHNKEREAIDRENSAKKGAGSIAAAVVPQDANKHGAEYLATLQPGTANIVGKIVDYTLDPKTIPQRGNERSAILAHAIQVDPKFDASEYPNRYALKKDFTSGKTADNIVSLDQAINHMGTLKELTAAIANNDVKMINRVTSKVADEMGKPSINSAQLATQAVAAELMRVFRQVNASESEAKAFEQRLNAGANSPAQMDDALKVGGELLGGRLKAINQKWNKGMKTDTGYPELLSPDAAAAFEKITGKPAAVSSSQKAIPSVKDEAGYNALPPGSQYIAPDGSTRTKGK